MNLKQVLAISTVALISTLSIAQNGLTKKSHVPQRAPLPYHQLVAADDSYTKTDNNRIFHEYLVWLKKGADINKITAGLNNNINGEPEYLYHVVNRLTVDYDIYLIKVEYNVKYPGIELGTNRDPIYSLKNQEGILIAQYNHKVELRATVPNDASFTNQYSLRNTGQNGGTAGADIDATLAWDITTGGLTTLGDTIVVAVIDGGFQLNHPDLTQNIFRNWGEIAGNNIDDDGNGYVDDINGWDAFGNDGGIASDQHGTHVSGIIGARGNNGIGVSGVNWAAKVMTIAGSSGNEATVVSAYGYAAKMRRLYNQTNGLKGAYVVSTNSSFGVDLGDPGDYPIWCAFYDTLGAVGILSAGATANANYNVDTQGDIPTACVSNFLVTVTNTTNTDAKNGSCGYGLTTIDLGSPGTNTYSTVTNSGYQNLTGTSMATPHVAGSIGLMYAAACPELVAESKVNPGVVATLMKQYLLDGTDPIASMANITVTGGRLNVYNALLNVQTYPCNPNSPPTAAFAAGSASGCAPLVVSFNNNSSFNADTYQWYFPGGVPSQSTDEDPVVTYNSLGQYNVKLIAYNSFGSDTIELINYVDVNTNGTVTVYTEDFDGASLNAIGWSTVNPDGENTWELATVAGNSPGTQAARVNIFQNQANVGERDGLISPSYDFSNNTDFMLYFEHAHRRRVTSVRDSMIIYVSTDGGNTFPTRVFARAENGQGSFATAGTLTSNFVPATSDDWCLTGNVGTACLSVDLSQFDGQPNVKLKFEIYNSGGNNIYLDNIELRATCAAPVALAPVSQFSAATGVCLKDTVQFTDLSLNVPTQWTWIFEGGSPATSTQQNPEVIYNNAGTYDVTLITENSQGDDTLVLANYITVYPLPTAPTITDNAGTLTSSPAAAYQWNDANGPINGANQQSYTPVQGGIYTVTITDANGCKATSNPFLVGINEIPGISGMNIYPNPATDNLFIAITTNQKKVLSVDMLNTMGQLVWSHTGIAVNGNTIIEAPLTNLAKGVYFLRINQTANYKVVVK
jgi:PKD repeat protein